MKKELIHSCPERLWTKIANTTVCLMEDGNGRFGSGKVRFCRKAVAHTANFSKARLHLSVVNGGLIFAITEGVFIHIQRKEV